MVDVNKCAITLMDPTPVLVMLVMSSIARVPTSLISSTDIATSTVNHHFGLSEKEPCL